MRLEPRATTCYYYFAFRVKCGWEPALGGGGALLVVTLVNLAMFDTLIRGARKYFRKHWRQTHFLPVEIDMSL